MKIADWVGAPALAGRAADTQKEIDADPTDATVIRGKVVVGTFRVRIVAANRAPRLIQTEGAAARQADVAVIAMPGTDLRAGDRLKTTKPGEFYRLTFVAPGQEWRVEADGVAEA